MLAILGTLIFEQSSHENHMKRNSTEVRPHDRDNIMSKQSLYIKSKYYYSVTLRYISKNYETYVPEIWNTDSSNALHTMCNKKGLFGVRV